jgi:hypothetical protein
VWQPRPQLNAVSLDGTKLVKARRFHLASWIACFVAAALAQTCSELIYRLFVVPRLPRVQSVPLIWWGVVYSPIALVFAVILFRRPWNWLAGATAIGLGVSVACIVIDAVRGRTGLPVSHDLFFGTTEYLFSAMYRSVIISLFFLFIAWVGSAVIRLVQLNRRW